MSFDLSNMNVEQLKTLRNDIDAAIVNKQAEGRVNLKLKFEQEAAEAGLTLEEIVGLSKKTSVSFKEKRIVAIKYRHPSDPSLAWTGRGMAPKWVREYEAQGGNRLQLVVN